MSPDRREPRISVALCTRNGERFLEAQLESLAAPREGAMTPRLTIVIVSWNTRELLRACLASLERAPQPAEREVIVVDNGSRDGTPRMVREEFPGVLLLVNELNEGFARAVNRGARRARGRYLLLLNSDTEIVGDALSACARYLDGHPEAAAVGCRLLYPDGRRQSSCFRFPNLRGLLLQALYLPRLFPHHPVWNFGRYGQARWSEPRRVDCVMGSFLMLRAGAVAGEPLLDEGYFLYAEEADLCYRLALRGGATVYLPGAEIVHRHGGSSRAVPVWAAHASRRGTLRFFYKWRGPGIAWLANALMLAEVLPRAAAAAVLHRGERAARRRALAFHLRALVRPRLLAGPWEPPELASPEAPLG